MAVLVGNYLLDCEAVASGHYHRETWIGAWTLFRSPNADHCRWEALTTGRTLISFDNMQAALDAALEAGAENARTLQSDPSLEPMRWNSTLMASASPRRVPCSES